MDSRHKKNNRVKENKNMKKIIEVLRIGLENMGVQVQKLSFSLPSRILDYKKKTKEINKSSFQKKRDWVSVF